MSLLVVLGVAAPVAGLSAFQAVKAHRAKKRRLARRDRWNAEARRNMGLDR